MKKLIATALLVLFSASYALNAQGVKKLQMAPSMGVGINVIFPGVSNSYEFVIGAKLTDKLFLGGGTGFNLAAYVDGYYLDYGYDYGDYYQDMSGVTMPLFGQIKYNFNTYRGSVFISADLGYDFDITGKGMSGGFIRPMFGVDVMFGRAKSWGMFAKAGFMVKGYYYNNYSYTTGLWEWLSVIPELKVGFLF